MNLKMNKKTINKISELVESIRSTTTDKKVINMTMIVEKCLDIVDDLQEDNLFLLEENERLRFELQDKRFETNQSRGGRRRVS